MAGRIVKFLLYKELNSVPRTYIKSHKRGLSQNFRKEKYYYLHLFLQNPHKKAEMVEHASNPSLPRLQQRESQGSSGTQPTIKKVLQVQSACLKK